MSETMQQSTIQLACNCSIHEKITIRSHTTISAVISVQFAHLKLGSALYAVQQH